MFILFQVFQTLSISAIYILWAAEIHTGWKSSGGGYGTFFQNNMCRGSMKKMSGFIGGTTLFVFYCFLLGNVSKIFFGGSCLMTLRPPCSMIYDWGLFVCAIRRRFSNCASCTLGHAVGTIQSIFVPMLNHVQRMSFEALKLTKPKKWAEIKP